MALKTIVSKGKKLLKGLKGDKRTKVGKKVEAAKTKVKQAVTPKKTTPKKTAPKVTPKKTTTKPAVKPRQISFGRAKATLAGTAAGGAGVGYMAGKSGNKKVETKKPAPKKTVNTPKKEQTYYKSNPNKSNALRPDYTPKKVETKKEEKFDRMKAAREQMKKARGSMGFKKGGSCKSKRYASGGMVKRDGCAMRGKTRGKLI